MTRPRPTDPYRHLQDDMTGNYSVPTADDLNLREDIWPRCPSKETTDRSHITECPQITSRYYPGDLQKLPRRISRAALAITLGLHSGSNKQVFCEKSLDASLQTSSRIIQTELDGTTVLEDLLQIVQRHDVPIQSVDVVNSPVWENISAFLRFQSPDSFPQSQQPDDRWEPELKDRCHRYEVPLSIDVFPLHHGVTQIRFFSEDIAEDIDAFADHFIEVFALLVAPKSPSSCVYDIHRTLGKLDQVQTVEFGRRNQLPDSSVPPRLVHHLFEAHARISPTTIALEFEAPSTNMSYGELDALASHLAKNLQTKFIISPDTPIPILFDISFEMIIAILAVLKAGGAYVPLALDLPNERIQSIIKLISATVLLCGNDLAARAAEFVAAVPNLRVVECDKDLLISSASDNASSVSPSWIPATPKHLAYVLFTSGTTGVPNGVGVEHRNVTAYLESSIALQMSGKGTRKLLLSPYTFDLAAGDLFTTLTSGGTLLLVQRTKMLSNLPYWLDAMKTTHVSTTPSIGRVIPSDGIPTLTHVFFGGEILPLDLASRLGKMRTVINGYGPTETTVNATAYTVPKGIERSQSNRVPVGYPIGTTIIYILRPLTTELAARGEVGEICIGGPQVARGYITNPELSVKKFVRDVFQDDARLFRTGDLGRWNRLGQLEILGRMDSQLKFHGIRIETGEIERIVKNASGADGDIDLVSSTVLDIHNEQKLVGILTLSSMQHAGNAPTILGGPGSVQVDSALILARNACAQQLPPTVQPSLWLCLDSLPRSSHGKLDNRKLHTLIRQHMELTNNTKILDSASAAKTDDGEMVAAMLSRVLACPRESINFSATFIELGGTSIHAMRVSTALQVCGIDANVTDVLDNTKTISMLAKLPKLNHLYSARLVAEKVYSPLSLAPTNWEEDARALNLTAEDIEDVYPVSPLADYWLRLTLQNGGRVLICQFHHALGSDIDPDRFLWCWEQLRLREPTLRTVFAAKRNGSQMDITSLVLKGYVPNRGANIEVVTVSDGDELQQMLFTQLFGRHRFELGKVPIKGWLLYNRKDNLWFFSISRHHALHDARTLDLQNEAFSLLYAQGSAGFPEIESGRSWGNSYGAYIASLNRDTGLQESFWKNYLLGVTPPVWPSPKRVTTTFSKDTSKFAFHVTEWKGRISDISKRLGVTPGALLRGAYAVATAEGDGNEDTLVFEVTDGSNAAGLSPPPWGLCLHVKPTRIHVSLEPTGAESSHLVDIMRQANRGHVESLPYLGHSWDMTAKILSERVEPGTNVVTSLLNILDLSRGDFRKDMKNEDVGAILGASTSLQSKPSEHIRSIFNGTLAFETMCDVCVPVYVEVRIWKEKVIFACPFDPDTADRKDIETFVGRQTEVLDTLSTRVLEYSHLA